jgi:hypothetical protein
MLGRTNLLVLNPGMIKILIISVLFIHIVAVCDAQDPDDYFVNKEIADSLIRLGRYEQALPNIRKCVSAADFATVADEFFLGYACFKAANIDSAALFLNKALDSGFHFQKMEYVEYWKEHGVFEKFSHFESLASVPEALVRNTRAYVDNTKFDSALARQLVQARMLDQRYRSRRAEDSQAPADSLWKIQVELDKDNRALLKKVIARHGWPGQSIVGFDGANAAFLIAQHSDLDTVFQRQCLGYLHAAYRKQDLNIADYGYLIDRVRVNTGRPQLFGTQFYVTDVNGKLKLQLKPVERSETLNLRRKVFGLPPVEEYLSASEKRVLR